MAAILMPPVTREESLANPNVAAKGASTQTAQRYLEATRTQQNSPMMNGSSGIPGSNQIVGPMRNAAKNAMRHVTRICQATNKNQAASRNEKTNSQISRKAGGGT